ncbi:glycoside hydrolase family 43 protein [Sphingomonas arantia]|uniref:Glycoside hydrolase family 43 protein n=1 Tax=Sphingomonas arantia TaxID=1460676 RepID=A0ABW4TTF1_9SPHN
MSFTKYGLALAAALLSTAATSVPEDRIARFEQFVYSGEDGAAPPAGSYRNPVLAGYYPDPSVTRVGDDFYLVNSTFSWFPGIPVFHSRDLVTWRQIGNAIDRPGQLDYKRLGMSRGIFAPDITHHDGRFYIVTTCVDCGGNFVITARDPAGPWSDPVRLPTVGGIDPSLFFDTDGSAWIINNRDPIGPPRYDGHRALWMERFDTKTMKMLGNPKMVVDGGVDPAAKPVWIEGPHILKVDGRYYLTAAEGGTAVAHSQVVFRSDKIDGPYVPAPKSVNPILTQRDLDPARPKPITSAGHADLVQLKDGSWWATFLATRPYEGDLYNIGRETYLLPVTWANGWPSILPRGQAIPTIAPRPKLAPDPRPAPPMTGSFTVRDDFPGNKLSQAWMTMRTPRTPGWTVGGGALMLEARPDGIGDHAQPSYVARRQMHDVASAAVTVTFRPTEGAEAGLAAVQDDDHFLGVALTRAGGKLAVRAFRREDKDAPAIGRTVAVVPIVAAVGSPVRLRISARGPAYTLAYAVGSGAWQQVAVVDGTILSTAKAGGFTGTMIGPFARAGR